MDTVSDLPEHVQFRILPMEKKLETNNHHNFLSLGTNQFLENIKCPPRKKNFSLYVMLSSTDTGTKPLQFHQ
jgi:hypothetical protein